MSLNVAGLDLSIVKSGYAVGAGDDVQTGLIKTRETRDDRLTFIRDEVRTKLESIFPVAFVMVEGPASFSKTILKTGMVHGAVRSMLIEYGYGYGTMPPTSLKKYATGAGDADKSLMRMNAYKRAGLEFDNDDEADAWWLWVAARDMLGDPVFKLPAVQRDQLKNITKEWPA